MNTCVTGFITIYTSIFWLGFSMIEMKVSWFGLHNVMFCLLHLKKAHLRKKSWKDYVHIYWIKKHKFKYLNQKLIIISVTSCMPKVKLTPAPWHCRLPSPGAKDRPCSWAGPVVDNGPRVRQPSLPYELGVWRGVPHHPLDSETIPRPRTWTLPMGVSGVFTSQIIWALDMH